MSIEELVRIADSIAKIYMVEEIKINHESKPKLIHNIAFTKYNDALGFDPLSFEAFTVTSLINDYIIHTYYQDIVKYSKPDTNYVVDKDSYVVFGDQESGYVIEDHRKTM